MTIDASSSNEEILDVLHRTADAVAGVLQANTDWSLSGQRATQYSVDLAADAAALAVLHGAGCAVLSEESQITGEWKPGGLMVVMDPLDGSTNASKRVPWYATALCAIDGEGMRASLVVNQASGRDRYWASRGGGAFHNDIRLQVTQRNMLRDSVVGISGLPNFRPAWGQFRALGAAALDICLVATGALDGWIDFNSHGVWDYLASVLVCQEAGVVVSEFQSRDLVVTQYAEKRTPLVASSRELLDELRAVREQHQSR
ncbi:MAG: inositol monophosphatase family protein [Actinomycetota bacterium]